MPTFADPYLTARLADARDAVGHVFARHALRLIGARRPLAMRHAHAALGELSFNRLAYGAEVEVCAPRLTDFYLLQLTETGRCEIDSRGQHLCVAGGAIAVMNPAHAYTKQWSGDASQIIVRIERRVLDAQLAERGRCVEFAFASFDAGARLAPLRRFLRYLESELADPYGAAIAARGSAPLAQHLARLMLDCIPHLSRPAYTAPAYVRAAERCMREHLAGPWRMPALAAAAGIGVRSLDNGFRATHGVSTMHYLRNLRLDATHARLQAGEECAIAEIAAAVGMHHPGRFAAQFRQRFGITPAQVLHQR